MKRRRSDFSSSKTNQLKISKFFPVNSTLTNNPNNRDESTTENSGLHTKTSLSKSLKLAVPFSIDVLEDETYSSPSSFKPAKSTLDKLQQFVQHDKNSSDDETTQDLSRGIPKQPIPALAVQSEICRDVSGNSLLDYKKLNLKLTPLEKQIVALKEEHPTLLLVVECGYKYQMFGEDAEQAGRVLNMIAYKKNNFLSCSFPLHRLSVHVKKLVTNGCKVGIVRQKETSALKATSDSKHTPFKRELDIVFTKATFTDDFDGSLDTQHIDIPLCMTFVAEAYAKTDGSVAQIGVLSFFTQDGTVVFDHFQDDCSRNGLDSKLTHLQPSEIVLPDRGVTSQTLNLVRQFNEYKLSNGDYTRTEFTTHFDWINASESLSKIFCKDSEMMEKLKDLPPVIHCCIAMAYFYLKQFKLEQLVDTIKSVKPREAADEVLRIDGNCVRNLGLVPLSDQGGPQLKSCSVFHILNRTRTKFGARLLRSWLLKPLTNSKMIELRLDAVAWFVEHEQDPEFEPLKKTLKSLQDLEKQLMAVLSARSKPKEFCRLCYSWEQLRVLSLELNSRFQSVFPSLIQQLFDTVIMSLEVVESYIGQLNNGAVNSGEKTKLFNRIDDYPEMVMLIEKIQNVEGKLQAMKPSICKTIGLLAFNYVTVSGDEYLIEVKNAFLKAVPSSWIKISATKQCCRFRSPEIHQLYGELCCFRELLKVAADDAWVQFQRQVAITYSTLKRANIAVATLDCLIALAEVAKCENFVRPSFVDQAGVLDICQGRHPVVSRAVQQALTAEYVPNDTRLNANDVRCMIITGPNMGGKSCLLSQVGIIVVLAQIGSFVPANRATLSIFKSIFIRMGLHDEIYAGRSTFFVEMMETASILKNGSSRSLVIIDELGRGTGTHDGSAIAYATLEHLVKKMNCLTLFVTHYPAVVQLENDVPMHVANYHMGYLLNEDETENEESKNSVVFLYTLTPGKCPKSFGLNVARLAGIQSSIIDRAKLKSETFFSEAEFQLQQFVELKHIISQKDQ